MSAPPLPLTEKLVQCLRTLCAQPSVSGQFDDLKLAADTVAGLFHGLGMQVHLVHTAGAPVVIGRRNGRSTRTLLLYHWYDTPPPGPWRDWSHEPYQLAERDGALYGRGVSEGKGSLTAHIQALHALLQSDGELPCGVVIVAEGHGLLGSSQLAHTIETNSNLVKADACLASVGERNAAGVPICYSGSKGLLRVRLQARGPAHPLPAGMAPTLRNPLWRLIWALGCIKGDDEDIKIAGFYESVEGPTRDENALLRAISLDQAGRLQAWQNDEFLFGMSGAALIRAEATLPTCNVSAIECEPSGDLPILPAVARATLDFDLVPDQQPGQVFDQLRAHLDERGFADIAVELLPGGYPPARGDISKPFFTELAAAGSVVFGAAPQLAPAGPFVLPLQPFAEHLCVPVASLGLARPESSTYGPNEHIALDDLARHAQFLIEFLTRFANS